MYKKWCSFLLAFLMLLSLSACAGDGAKASSGIDGSTPSENNTFRVVPGGFLIASESATVELGTPDTPLDPGAVYDRLTYTPEMFYGKYVLPGGDAAEEQFAAESDYFTWTENGEERLLSEFPFELTAGKYSISHKLSYVREYDWMRVSFMRQYNTGSCGIYWVYCAYSVEGNRLILRPLDTFEIDTENDTIAYAFSGDVWEYTFEFSGRHLTLTSGEESVTLKTGLNAYGETDRFNVDHHPSSPSDQIGDIDKISIYASRETESSRSMIWLKDGPIIYDTVLSLQENGLFTLTARINEEATTYQFVYFYCGNDGIILTDGINTYYYNGDYADRWLKDLENYISIDQSPKVEEMTETQVEQIIQTKDNLMEDLVKAFDEADIKVTVDEQTGEIAMDASILFGGDSAALTDEGKAFLNRFLEVYTSIVFSEKYEGFVSRTVIEGHTAPLSGSTYESGLPLSVERANTVKDYCLSAESGVDTGRLAEALEAVGCSNVRPVMDAEGNVDIAASRRVSFLFMINLDYIS